MFDQLIISDKASYDDFGASVASRTISPPAKKSIKETVPFSNMTYDFSAINGELYWEERELEYIFEIDAYGPQELETKKTAFAGWIMNVMSAELHDPYISDYHFVATFDGMDFEDDETMLKTTANVVFRAYPYKIANNPTTDKQSIPAGDRKTLSIENGSNHRITPTITTDGPVEIVFGNVTYTASAGTFKKIALAVGLNTLEIKNTGTTECTVTISFFEEVF